MSSEQQGKNWTFFSHVLLQTIIHLHSEELCNSLHVDGLIMKKLSGILIRQKKAVRVKRKKKGNTSVSLVYTRGNIAFGSAVI